MSGSPSNEPTVAENATVAEAAVAAAAAANAAASDAQQNISGLDALPYKDRYFAARDETPPFEGKSSYPPEAFYTKVTYSCDTYKIAESDRVRLAISRLESDAAKFQAELTVSGEMPSTLEGLYAKLKARYPVSPEETAPYLLLHKTNMAGNNLPKFVQEFNRQVSRVGSGEAAWQSMLQELFLTGLSGNLRQIVEQSRPELGWTSLSSLQSSTAKAQQTLHLKNTKPSGSGSSKESGHKHGQGPHPDQPQPKRTNLRAGSGGPSRPYCSFCQKFGHDLEACRTVKRVQQSKN